MFGRSAEVCALILIGMVEHGLDLAASHLPVLCADDHARQQIRLAIPVLVDMFGKARSPAHFRGCSRDFHETSTLFASELGSVRIAHVGGWRSVSGTARYAHGRPETRH
jgi:hypothetical protein